MTFRRQAGGRPRRARAGAAPALDAQTVQINGAGRDVPESDLLEVVRRVQQAAPERADQLPVDRLGRRHPPAHQPDGLLRRHRRADDRRAAAGRARARSCTSRPCSAPSCPVYNIPGRRRSELKFTGPLLADIFLGKITKWNDPAIAKLNAGRDAAGHRHHRRAPLRRLGHDLHLGRLPGEGLAGVEEDGRRRRRRSTGRSASAARATRASPAWSARRPARSATSS